MCSSGVAAALDDQLRCDARARRVVAGAGHVLAAQLTLGEHRERRGRGQRSPLGAGFGRRAAGARAVRRPARAPKARERRAAPRSRFTARGGTADRSGSSPCARRDRREPARRREAQRWRRRSRSARERRGPRSASRGGRPPARARQARRVEIAAPIRPCLRCSRPPASEAPNIAPYGEAKLGVAAEALQLGLDATLAQPCDQRLGPPPPHPPSMGA